VRFEVWMTPRQPLATEVNFHVCEAGDDNVPKGMVHVNTVEGTLEECGRAVQEYIEQEAEAVKVAMAACLGHEPDEITYETWLPMDEATIPIEEALELTDKDEVVRQIHVRKMLRNQMVGQLYPNVLVDEIVLLVRLYEELGGDVDRLKDALHQIGSQGSNR